MPGLKWLKVVYRGGMRIRWISILYGYVIKLINS